MRENSGILTDKNGIEMKTGDIVKIENAYFKNDNGFYYIENTPGDLSWCGNEYSLHKICKNGKLSTASNHIAFWPLAAFCNDRAKNYAAREHNKQYATIEIIYSIDNTAVIEAIEERAKAAAENAKTYSYRFGENAEVTTKTEAIANYYQAIADKMKAEKATEPETPADLICEPELVASVVYDFGVSDIDEAETPAPEPEKEPETPAAVKKYYDISEETARRGHESVHMSDYKPGSATAEYTASVDEVYEIAERQKAKVSRYYHEKIDALADKYARRLAQWTNDYNRNSASCPSWFVCGPANYPVKKHERQMSRERTLWNEYDDIKGIIDKIKAVGTGPIDLADPNAREMLTERLEKLQKELEDSKIINSYWRKNKTLVGCPVVNQEKAEAETKAIQEYIEKHPWITAPVPAYDLTSLRDKIKRTTERLEELDHRQQTPTAQSEYDGFTVIENNDIMRLQIIFPGKPDEATRNILKSNGFKWAPSQSAWQRQLTENSRRALDRIISELQAE
jgi:hypothetical protein